MTTGQLTRQHLLIGLAVSMTFASMFWLLIFRTWSLSGLILIWLLGVNTTTFFYYGYDKQRARIGTRRVPEAALHGLSVAGGSLGAYFGMKWFRHKTIKGRFLILFWGIVILQVVILAMLFRKEWIG